MSDTSLARFGLRHNHEIDDADQRNIELADIIESKSRGGDEFYRWMMHDLIPGLHKEAMLSDVWRVNYSEQWRAGAAWGFTLLTERIESIISQRDSLIGLLKQEEAEQEAADAHQSSVLQRGHPQEA